MSILCRLGLLLFFISNAEAAYETIKEQKSPAHLSYSLVGNYMSGGYAMRNHNPEVAAAIFLDAVKKEPDNQILLKNAYNALLTTGKVAEAVDMAHKYLQYGSADAKLAILLAAQEIKNNEYGRAEDVLENVDRAGEIDIASGVGVVIIPFLKAWVLVGQGKYEEAQEYQENMLGNKRPPSLFMYYQNAMIEDIRGNYEKAEDDYSRLVKEGVMMPYHFVRAAGNFYERIGKPEHAKKIYERYRLQPPQAAYFIGKIKKIEQGEVTTRKVVPNFVLGFNEVLKEAVRILYNSGFYEDGLSYLRISLFLSPDDEESNMLLATYYEQQKKFKKARDIYKRIAKDSDFYIASRIGIADNLFDEGKKRNAIRQLLAISGEKKARSVVLPHLADLLRRDGDFERATMIYTRIIDSIAKPEPKNWPIFFARGICNERAGRLEDSEADLKKALQLNPDQPEVLNYLAYSWIDKDKNLNQAKNMLAKAVKARPHDAQIVDSMGWALFKVKDYENASKFLERAVEMIPYDPIINDHLGDVYWKQGRYNEARFQWNRVINHNENKEVSEKKLRDKIKNGLPVL
jgi:tetratricopeptide (TPR) repeat protein